MAQHRVPNAEFAIRRIDPRTLERAFRFRHDARNPASSIKGTTRSVGNFLPWQVSPRPEGGCRGSS